MKSVSKVFKRLLRRAAGLSFPALLLMVLGSIPVEARPFVYVTNSVNPATVSVIDTANNSVVATIELGSTAFDVAITPDGTRAYVAINAANRVAVIDTETNTVLTNIDVSPGGGPKGIAITPDGTRAYVTKGEDTVAVIDIVTNTVVDRINIGDRRPHGVAITPNGAFAYVANQFNDVTVIDTATNTVVATVEDRGSHNWVAITPDGTRAYVTNERVDTVSVIDTTTNQVVGTVDVSPERAPRGIAITPDGAFAYEANSFGGSNSVSVIDTATNTVVTTIAVGGSPEGIAITPFIADLAITKTASPDPVMAGSDLTYTLTVINNGPDPSMFVNVADSLPAETTFRSLEAPPDWSYTTPNVGENGTVNCTTSRLAANTTPTFTLVVNVNSQVPNGTVLSNTATVDARTFDPNPDNKSSTATVTVSNP